MRISSAAFFSSGTGSSLVGEGDPDDLILDCYRLARWFHQNPDLYLEMPLSRVQMHLHYAVKLHRVQQRAGAADAD